MVNAPVEHHHLDHASTFCEMLYERPLREAPRDLHSKRGLRFGKSQIEFLPNTK